MRGWLGVGYRRELHPWIQTHPEDVSCLEITAEHFFDSDLKNLKALAARYPLFVHGLGLSLGTPGPLDPETLKSFARVAQAADARWVSEHIAFTRTSEVDLGHLNPVSPSTQNAQLIAQHAREIADACGKPIVLENITSHLRLEGDLSETDFLNTICDLGNCGLLLDVTNLYINSRNHSFDPYAWVKALDPARIVQLHVVGYSEKNGVLEDFHAETIQPEILDLTRAVLEHAPVQAIIIERDQNFRSLDSLENDLKNVRHEMDRREYAAR